MQRPDEQFYGVSHPVGCFQIAQTHDDHQQFLSENDPTSIMWPILQGKTCMAKNTTEANETCILGTYFEYVVNVSSVGQTQLAVNFARNLNIRLVNKNTGHE